MIQIIKEVVCVDVDLIGKIEPRYFWCLLFEFIDFILCYELVFAKTQIVEFTSE